MSHLEQIKTRHGWDRWKDAIFIGGAVLLTALSIGLTTSVMVGKADPPSWTVKVIESNLEIVR